MESASADLSRQRWISGFTRWERNGATRLGVSSLELAGLHCAACAGVIEAALRASPGVLDAQVNPGSLRATVRWDPEHTQPEALLQAVAHAGYRAVPDGGVQAARMRQQEHRTVLWRFFVAAFLAMQVMMLATPSYVAGPGELAPDMRRLLNWGGWVLSLPVMAFAGWPFIKGAWHAMRAGRISMDVPVALGIAVSFVASSASTFAPESLFGPEVYFDSLTMFLAFLWGARYVELRLRHRAATTLEAALQSLPEKALRVRGDGSVERVAAESLSAGDRIRILAGEPVPADGTLLSDAAELVESMISGESLPVLRRAGEEILAGSRNAGPAFEMSVRRVGPDTRHEEIVALMRESLTQRPASVRIADRWAAPFLWGVLVVAAVAGMAWAVVEPSRALWVVVSVLVVTCPCALSLATPATLVAAASGLARRGVLLRRLEALESLARVQHLFLDKTGTLTEEQLQLVQVDLEPGWQKHEVLGIAAALARGSAHPMSRTLVQAAQDRVQGLAGVNSTTSTGATAGAALSSSQRPQAWSGVEERAGQGISAVDDQGRCWRMGSPSFAGDLGEAPAHQPLDASWVALSCEGQVVARFGLSERVRADAPQALAGLRALGLRLSLLSGDSPVRAMAVAQPLGLAELHAGASPEDKRALIRESRRGGAVVVGMVGDGLNDAPVMAAADVSLAMGHGAMAARQGADAVVLSSRPAAVLDAVLSAREAMKRLRQNLRWSVLYNLVALPLAALGSLPPWLAGLGMALSSLGVILNAQRAGRAPAELAD